MWYKIIISLEMKYKIYPEYDAIIKHWMFKYDHWNLKQKSGNTKLRYWFNFEKIENLAFFF